MKKALHVFIKIIEYFTLTILLLSFIVLAVPRFFGITPDIVLSGSMEPSIPTGSICFVDREADKYEIETDDVISYRLSNGTLVLHRVIGFDENGNYITKGDANDNEDFYPISPESFVGKAVFTIPYIGYIAEQLQHRSSMILLLTFIGMFTFLKVVNIASNINKKKEKEEANEKAK